MDRGTTWTDDGADGFRGCFISHPQKFSYIDGDEKKIGMKIILKQGGGASSPKNVYSIYSLIAPQFESYIL
jgi:hypothetical protein